jgi:hypothetical protein
MVDQETWPARSATVKIQPGKDPDAGRGEQLSASTTKPKKVESHATRRRVAPSFGGRMRYDGFACGCLDREAFGDRVMRFRIWCGPSVYALEREPRPDPGSSARRGLHS